jgi:sortase (surface protein transpeptidase)
MLFCIFVSQITITKTTYLMAIEEKNDSESLEKSSKRNSEGSEKKNKKAPHYETSNRHVPVIGYVYENPNTGGCCRRHFLSLSLTTEPELRSG